MPNVTIAVDIAKNVFEIAVSASAGRITERRRMTRQQFERFWGSRERCRVVMEGCSGAHYWARLLIFDVKLIPPRSTPRAEPRRPRCAQPTRPAGVGGIVAKALLTGRTPV